MCGRYANSTGTVDLMAEFRADERHGDDVAPSWNIAPTDPVRAVVERPHRGEDAPAVRQLRTVRWGLVPSWAKNRNGGARLINARQETVSEKPAFRSAAARRRCLLPAAGYYEWQKTERGKQPYFLHSPDGRLAFAGLYEIWRDPAADDDDPAAWLWTATIITGPASDTLGEIHDRTPVVVPADRWGEWLDCSADNPAVAAVLLAGMPEPHLQPRAVSTAVNSVRNDGPELIEPVLPELEQRPLF